MSKALVLWNPEMQFSGKTIFRKMGTTWNQVVPLSLGFLNVLSIAKIGNDQQFQDFLNRRKAIRNAAKRAKAEAKARDWRTILARQQLIYQARLESLAQSIFDYAGNHASMTENGEEYE